MFTIKNELENFPPVNFENIEASGISMAENVRSSIVLYNKAIESLKTNSEDIAIIELKKAISLNPHFYEAMNLLGICYAYVNDLSRAEEMFQKVMSGEHNSIQAMEYVKRLSGGSDSSSSKNSKFAKNTRSNNQNKRTQTSGIKPLNPPSRTVNSSSPAKTSGFSKKVQRLSLNKVIVVMCIVSFILGAFLVYITGFSATNKGQAFKNNASKNDSTIKDKTKDTSKDNSKEQLEQLQLDYDNAKSDLDTSYETINSLKTTNKLLQAENLITKGKTLDAANILISLKDSLLSEQDRQLYDTLSLEAYAKAAKNAFDQGYKAFNAKNYQDALKLLQNVQVFAPEYKDMDRVFYYIGKSYAALNDPANAVVAFQKVVDNYPNSKYTKYSSNRIKELQQN